MDCSPFYQLRFRFPDFPAFIPGFIVKTFLSLVRLSFQPPGGISPHDLSILSDEELMTAYSENGNIRAFEEIYRRYRVVLYGFLVNWTANPQKAEDIFQEVFFRVIKSASRYKPKAKFRTWLFTIARHLLIDENRKKQIHADCIPLAAQKDENCFRPEECIPGSAPDPGKSVESREVIQILQKTLAALPEEQREMFLLREQVGLSFKAAARIASCSVNTAKTRMRYALLKLREAYTREGIFPGRTIGR